MQNTCCGRRHSLGNLVRFNNDQAGVLTAFHIHNEVLVSFVVTALELDMAAVQQIVPDDVVACPIIKVNVLWTVPVANDRVGLDDVLDFQVPSRALMMDDQPPRSVVSFGAESSSSIVGSKKIRPSSPSQMMEGMKIPSALVGPLEHLHSGHRRR